MLGSIMPAPLQQAVMRTGRPATVRSAVTCLGRVSVVMMASGTRAAAAGSARAAAALRIPASTLAMGRHSPMRPVEQISISCSGIPTAAAPAAAMRRASIIPCSPVQALALPALTTMARARPVAVRAMSTFTGAAFTWLVV